MSTDAGLIWQTWRESADFRALTDEFDLADGRDYLRVLEPLNVRCNLTDHLESLPQPWGKADETIALIRARAQCPCPARRALLKPFLTFLCTEPDYVYWLEKSGRHRQITTFARLWKFRPFLPPGCIGFQSVILTSATLSVAGSLEYARRRGMAEGHELVVGSPLFCPADEGFFVRDMPMPTDAAAFPPAVAFKQLGIS